MGEPLGRYSPNPTLCELVITDKAILGANKEEQTIERYVVDIYEWIVIIHSCTDDKQYYI